MERAPFKCAMGGWWATLRIRRSRRVGRRSVHDGKRFQVANSGAFPVLFVGKRPGADTSAGWLRAAGPDAECTDSAAVQFGNARSSSPYILPLGLAIPHSHNPFDAYAPSEVPEPQLDNSPRIDRLIRDGKLYISLQDAIALALENNLDLAIARYNLPIADTDIQRTKAGASFRGVNTGVVGGTPGGGVGGFGTGAPGAGAGGTTGGAGGAGAGAAGLVQSTLGAGTPVQSYDPTVGVISGLEHQTTPLANLQIYGVPQLQLNTTQVNVNYTQSFPTGTSFIVRGGQQSASHEQYFQQPQPATGNLLPCTFHATTPGGIWNRP